MKKKLEEWLVEVLKKEDWNAFNDIHIDQLDPNVKKSKWIETGLIYLEELTSLKKLIAPKLLVAIAFSLRGSAKYKGLNFRGAKEMLRESDDSPPSFYAFPSNFKLFQQTIEKSLVIDNLNDIPKDVISLYFEYRLKGDEEFRRSIFFLKKNDFNRLNKVPTRAFFSE
jgi:hypothetical protein